MLEVEDTDNSSTDPLHGRIDRPATAAMTAAEKTFRRPGSPAWAAAETTNGTPFAEASESAARKADAGRRILPDLHSEDPFEARLRQEAEERAARRRGPRGPRPKSAEPKAGRTDTRPSPERPALRKTTPTRRPAEHNGAQAPAGPVVPLASRITVPNPGVAAEMARRDGKPRSSHSSWAHRKACRKAKRAGLPQPLRSGERWKRRLPQSCW